MNAISSAYRCLHCITYEYVAYLIIYCTHSWQECIQKPQSRLLITTATPFWSFLEKWSVDVNASRFCRGAGLYFACDARLSHHFNRGCRRQSTAQGRLVLARVAVGHCAADSVWLSWWLDVDKISRKVLSCFVKGCRSISLSHLSGGETLCFSLVHRNCSWACWLCAQRQKRKHCQRIFQTAANGIKQSADGLHAATCAPQTCGSRNISNLRMAIRVAPRKMRRRWWCTKTTMPTRHTFFRIWHPAWRISIHMQTLARWLASTGHIVMNTWWTLSMPGLQQLLAWFPDHVQDPGGGEEQRLDPRQPNQRAIFLSRIFLRFPLFRNCNQYDWSFWWSPKEKQCLAVVCSDSYLDNGQWTLCQASSKEDYCF